MADKEMTEKASRRRLWTPEEDNELRRLLYLGVPRDLIAARFGRSEHAINARSKLLGVLVRRGTSSPYRKAKPPQP